MECKINALMDDDGKIVIEVDSEECQQVVITAISAKGINVRYVKPKQIAPQTELG